MQNKTYREALREGQQMLSGIADAEYDARCLLEFCCGLTRAELIFRYAEPMPQTLYARYLSMLHRRADGEPLQYILGAWDFFGRTFRVFEGVLIPRPETEYLPEKAVRMLPQGAVVFDVCAGTGCIGLSVALERPDTKVFLLEKYDAPFRCLTENKARLDADTVTAERCDLLCGIPEGLPQPDCILSNPPYICTGALPGLQAEVQREPREALDGGTDGLLFYRALREKWYPHLSDGGFMLLECGEAQPQTVASMFPCRTEIERDYVGTERFVTVFK